MSTPERRRRLPQPYQRPDSPYPVPQTPFRQTFALTSPRRAEPFLVSIGIDPKPLICTENGEHFICDISLDVQPGESGMLPQTPQAIGGAIPFQLDKSADSDRTFVGDMSDSSSSSERTLMNANSPIIRGQRMERYNVSPEVTPRSIHREGLLTSSAEMNGMTSPERRERLPEPYRRQDSPYPLPQTPFRTTNALDSPFQRDWSADSDRTLVNEMSDFSSSSERTPVNESTPKGVLKRNIRDAPSPEPSPVIKGPFYRPQSQISDYYGPYSEPPPVIDGPCYRPQSQMSDSYESYSEPYRSQLQMSDYYGSSSDALDTSAGTSREGTPEKSYSPIIKRRRRVRYDIPHTSTELYTPRGISKGKRRRRIPGRHPISELPWSPTYLPEDARSPVSGVMSPPHWINRSISWEKSDEISGTPPEPSPVIKRPFYAPQSYSDRSSPSPVIKAPFGYQPPSDEIYSDYDTSPSPLNESYDRHRSPYSNRSSLSPVIKPPFGYQPSSDESFYESSPSPVNESYDRHRSPYSDRSSLSPVIKPPFGYQPSSDESFYESSPSPVNESYDRHRSPYSDRSSLSPVIKPPFGYQPSSDESFYESSPSPINESYDRHRSPYSDSSSQSPVINPPFGYQQPRDENYYESSPSTVNEPSGGCPSPDWDSILPVFYPDSANNRR